MRRENWALLFLVCARLLRFDALSCANVCKENWQELASVDGPKIPLAISHQSVVSGQELRGEYASGSLSRDSRRNRWSTQSAYYMHNRFVATAKAGI
jgi:hypothetical protein